MSWQDLLEAASRKVDLAEYHLACLATSLMQPPVSDKQPPVPVQAHFEGVVVCVLAAIDQVAQAVNSACGLHLRTADLVERAFARASLEVPDVAKWFKDPIGRDLRRVRTRMVHYSYAKLPNLSQWLVEDAGTEYTGSREVLEYARAAVRYGHELRQLAIEIAAVLASSQRS